VVADDGHADARKAELELREVPEVAEAQLDADQRVVRSGHGHAKIYGGRRVPATPPPGGSRRRRKARRARRERAPPPYSPLNFAGRFSRNACMPSRMSAVAASSPNRCASSDSASSTAVL